MPLTGPPKVSVTLSLGAWIRVRVAPGLRASYVYTIPGYPARLQQLEGSRGMFSSPAYMLGRFSSLAGTCLPSMCRVVDAER